MRDSLGWSFPVERDTCIVPGCDRPTSSSGRCARHRIAMTVRERRPDEWGIVPPAPATAVIEPASPVAPEIVIDAVLAAIRVEPIETVPLMTYPSTGTIHLIDGGWTPCGIYADGFRQCHPDWSALYEPAGEPSAITCKTCRKFLRGGD